MYWLTFQGSKRTAVHGHDGPWQMSVPLVILAVGATLFWLTIGPYSSSMVASLSQYPVVSIPLATLINTTFGSPVIWVTLGVVIFVILLGMRWKRTVTETFRKPSTSTLPLTKGYWFDSAYYSFIEHGVLGSSRVIRKGQTGSINYNIIGIVVGLGVFLALLSVWGLA